MLKKSQLQVHAAFAGLFIVGLGSLVVCSLGLLLCLNRYCGVQRASMVTEMEQREEGKVFGDERVFPRDGKESVVSLFGGACFSLGERVLGKGQREDKCMVLTGQDRGNDVCWMGRERGLVFCKRSLLCGGISAYVMGEDICSVGKHVEDSETDRHVIENIAIYLGVPLRICSARLGDTVSYRQLQPPATGRLVCIYWLVRC